MTGDGGGDVWGGRADSEAVTDKRPFPASTRYLQQRRSRRLELGSSCLRGSIPLPAALQHLPPSRIPLGFGLGLGLGL